MTEIQKQQIAALRTKGLVFAEIANKMNLSINSVKSYCRRNEIVPDTTATTDAATAIDTIDTIQNQEHIDEPTADVLPESYCEPRTACKLCGETLVNTPGHRQKTFCSAFCQRKYWRQNRSLMRHPSFITTTCPNCGHTFSDYAGHKRKYCSHTCYIKARYGKGDVNESERIDLSCDNEAVSENG